MALTIEDLKPKKFTIDVKGVKLECNPPRLSHSIISKKVGQIMDSPNDYTTEEIVTAEKEIDGVLGELIPEVKDIKLDSDTVLSIINEILEHIEPEDNKYLEEKGVKFNADPKAPEQTG